MRSLAFFLLIGLTGCSPPTYAVYVTADGYCMGKAWRLLRPMGATTLTMPTADGEKVETMAYGPLSKADADLGAAYVNALVCARAIVKPHDGIPVSDEV